MPVRSMADIAAARTDLDAAAIAQCQGLLRDLGLLADLAFSDLILWLPVWNSGGYVAAAQVRPSTAPTRYPTDVVGTFTPRGRRPELDRALQAPGLGQVAPRSDPLLPAAGEAIGIGRSVNGPWFAALTRSAVSVNRVAGTLERAYLQAADDLFAMIRGGDFPYREVNDSTGAEPRVGDGLLRVDTAGVVVFASPNASSAFRRLGLTTDLVGAHLGVAQRADRPAQRLRRRHARARRRGAAARGGGARIADRDGHGALPAASAGRADRGSLVLVRDVTELRRRERALLSKDATIREIHHRVKNNLQTVAALLRLQSRRLSDPGAVDALAEAERRVAAIAVVHDLLAQDAERVPFDDVADRLVGMIRQTATPDGEDRSIVRSGSLGDVPAERATALSMALAELLANAVEHGLGEIRLDCWGDVAGLHLVVTDAGPGSPTASRSMTRHGWGCGSWTP